VRNSFDGGAISPDVVDSGQSVSRRQRNDQIAMDHRRRTSRHDHAGADEVIE